MSLPERLGSLRTVKDDQPVARKEAKPPIPVDSDSGQLQRCVIIQKDEKGYGLTVSGDNPVFVQSVKPDGAASKAGVQQGDKIIKVNGTSALSLNHIEVVNLIKCKSRHFAFIYKNWFHFHKDFFQIDRTCNLMFPCQQNLFYQN
ncbi:Rho guanine nucleotide exchange factor 11 [Octopus vulgaris]|uniref:Rho guanine nucleotide exchange factor 11 n=1 Tax=Octopus vulgaris TaxID=6645 RepID=A0AA36AVX8_OCTVU|nr:Rho guanine nucleotide exchange factor 11 [Octopus vulgaris]